MQGKTHRKVLEAPELEHRAGTRGAGDRTQGMDTKERAHGGGGDAEGQGYTGKSIRKAGATEVQGKTHRRALEVQGLEHRAGTGGAGHTEGKGVRKEEEYGGQGRTHGRVLEVQGPGASTSMGSLSTSSPSFRTKKL